MERDKSLDYAKAIGILFVVLGHSPYIPELLYKYIYAFHMPLFFIISGYLFNTGKYSAYQLKDIALLKFKRYVIPYFLLSFICFIVFGVLYPIIKDGYNDQTMTQMLKYLAGILYSRGTLEWMPNCSPLWFLTCLYIAEIIFYSIFRYIKKPFIIFSIIAFASSIVSLYLKVKLPWNIDTSLTAVVLMYVGYLIRKHNIMKRVNLLYCIPLLIIYYFSVHFNPGIVDFNSNKYGNMILMYTGAISATIVLLFICSYLKNIKILLFFGKNTLQFIGFNYACKWITTSGTFTKYSILNNLLVNFFLQVALLSVITLVINKIIFLMKHGNIKVPRSSPFYQGER